MFFNATLMSAAVSLAPCVTISDTQSCEHACISRVWCSGFVNASGVCLISGVVPSYGGGCGTSVDDVMTTGDWRVRSNESKLGCYFGVCRVDSDFELPVTNVHGEMIEIVLSISDYSGVLVNRTKPFRLRGVGNGLVLGGSGAFVNASGGNVSVVLSTSGSAFVTGARRVTVIGDVSRLPIIIDHEIYVRSTTKLLRSITNLTG